MTLPLCLPHKTMLVFNDTTNKQGFVQEIRDRTGQTALSVERIARVLNLALDDYVNLALQTEGFAEGVAPYTDVTSSAAYIDTDDYLTIDRIQRLNSDGSYTSLDRVEDIETTAGSGTPTQYLPRGARTYFYPTPDGSYTYRVWHSVKATHFEADDTTATFGKTHQEYLILSACYKIMFSTNDPMLVAIRAELQKQELAVREYFATRYGVLGSMRPEVHIAE